MEEQASQESPKFPFKTFPKPILKDKKRNTKVATSLSGIQLDNIKESHESVKKAVSFRDIATNDPKSLAVTVEVESYKEYNQDIGAYSKIGNTTGCACIVF